MRRCLQKEPKQRLHDAADARIEIEDAATADAGTVLSSPRPTTYPFVSIALALVAGVAIASAFWWMRARSANVTAIPMHLSVALAPGSLRTVSSLDEQFAISPDGQWIVHGVVRDGRQQLFLRALREPEGKLIHGTDGAAVPFFSPDGQWIGFFSSKALNKVPVSGGSPIALCSLSSTGFVGGVWGSDNRIIFVPTFNGGIWTVSANGGTPELLLKTDERKDRIAYTHPQVLPGSKGILFNIASGRAITVDDEDIAILESGATEPRILIHGGSNARYVSTGHLVYVRGGALLSVPFDLSRIAVTGTPTSVIEGIERNILGDSFYFVSQNGTLVYEPSAGLKGGPRLVIVDRKGSVRAITDGHSYPADLSVSPNGNYVAARVVAVNDDLWTFDIAQGTPLRLTFEPPDEIFPQWTPDGTRIAFGTRIGKIFWKLADGTGQREEISRGEYPRYPSSFSSDGKTLAFVEGHPSRQRDIWLMPLDGDRKAQPFQNTDADEWAPKFSPDGHWLAYVSNETGRDEIYIRPIGSPGGRKRVSTEGGGWPAWARNGRELFFLKGDKLAAVTLDAQGNLVGRDRVVLDAPKLDDLQFQAASNDPNYDVMPDGEHFVMLLSPQYPSPTHYNVVVNWFEELKRRVP